ncbi:S-adenosyl-L-methionine-dependent methyltransferase [Pyronema omphalodes]|nr:S-adenosyl-L-methionine-dependent methyltransferase [Pyronema omphalodes]
MMMMMMMMIQFIQIRIGATIQGEIRLVNVTSSVCVIRSQTGALRLGTIKIADYGRAALYLRRASGVSVHLPEPKKYEPGLQDDWDESIEADDSDESDSDESDSSGAESLGSSIYEYLFEHGRRYHSYFGENKNLIPIDERENERQNLHHEAFRVLLDNRLHLTPLKTPARILDIGCGAGKWAIDMAEKYPDCEVVGVDLSPIQPTTVPKNLTFVVHDVERRWTFGENKFDFIHIRNLAQGISNWKYVISRAYAALKPGGFIELSELETTANCDDNGGLPDNDEIKIFMDKLNSALLKLGRSPATKESMINHLMTTDFINVEATTFKHPFGPWSKDEKLKKVGAMNEEDCGTMFTAYGLAAFTRVLEMDICDAVEICQDAGYAEGRTYSNFHVVYAQKPTAG